MRYRYVGDAYNVEGSLSERTDQRGVVIGYSYTNNRLSSLESVTTLPSGVDGTVRSIAPQPPQFEPSSERYKLCQDRRNGHSRQ